LVVELPTMEGLASHCHERLTNTKRGKGSEKKWRKMEIKGDGMLQMNDSLSTSHALAPCYLIE